MPFEIEVQLQDSFVKLTFESVSFLDLPLSVYDCEGDVFVRSTCMEAYSIGVLSTVWFNKELRSHCFIKQIRVENVELVALNNFRWRIFTIVMCLVVLIPFISLLHRVEESGFTPLLLSREVVVVSHLSIGCLSREKLFLLTQNDIRKLLLICSEPFVLCILEHLERGIIKAKVIDDVKADSCIKSCLLDLFSQAELLLWGLNCNSFSPRRTHVILKNFFTIQGSVFSSIRKCSEFNLLFNFNLVIYDKFIVNHFYL